MYVCVHVFFSFCLSMHGVYVRETSKQSCILWVSRGYVCVCVCVCACACVHVCMFACMFSFHFAYQCMVCMSERHQNSLVFCGYLEAMCVCVCWWLIWPIQNDTKRFLKKD